MKRSLASSTEWTEIRLIGSRRAVEGAVRILATGAEIRSDTGTRPAQKGKDGKVRRHLVARLAPAVQDSTEALTDGPGATDAAAEGIDLTEAISNGS